MDYEDLGPAMALSEAREKGQDAMACAKKLEKRIDVLEGQLDGLIKFVNQMSTRL